MATKKQVEADRVDLELDRLARRVHARFEDDRDPQWAAAYVSIQAARRAVRGLMSEKRRAETEG